MAFCLFFRPTLEECLRWKQSFEKLLSSKCKQNLLHSFTPPPPPPAWQNSTTHARSRAPEEPRHFYYRHAPTCNYISSLFPPDGLCAFTAFLVSEFSEENIAFYFACEDYRNTKSPAKLPAKAQKIFDEFIGSDAPREVTACFGASPYIVFNSMYFLRPT